MTLKAVQDYYHSMIFDPHFVGNEATANKILPAEMSTHLLAQPENRRALYRGFIQNNVSEILKAAFEIFFTLLPKEKGDELIRNFLNRHNPRTNIYKNIPHEFLADLQAHEAGNMPWPFLLELAEADFLDYDLRLRPNFENSLTDPNLPLEKARVVPNPALALRHTNFDVTTLTAKTDPKTVQAHDTYYARYRHPDTFEIHTVLLSALSFTFLENLLAQPETSLALHIENLGLKFPEIPTEALTQNLVSFLGDLLSRQMVLGLA